MAISLFCSFIMPKGEQSASRTFLDGFYTSWQAEKLVTFRYNENNEK